MNQKPDNLVARALKILMEDHRKPSDEVLTDLATTNARPMYWEAKRDWLPTWRVLATLTSGLTADDPRLPVVMAALNACDDAYLSGNWIAFRQAAARVRRAVEIGESSVQETDKESKTIKSRRGDARPGATQQQRVIRMGFPKGRGKTSLSREEREGGKKN